MTTIYLETEINAPLDVCFDLSRSIDLHQLTTASSNEKAIDGKTKGLIEKGEFVTWEATHFFIRQHMTVKIVEALKPHFFHDEMVKGPFRSMYHIHAFRAVGNTTLMIDDFQYNVPYGFAGRIFDGFVLKKYMTKLLRERNMMIKKVAESGEWKKFINKDSFVNTL